MYSELPHSIAAPGGAQDARHPSATSQAPVSPRQGAAIERGNAHQNAGAGAPGAGIAGMAGSASAARPQDSSEDPKGAMRVFESGTPSNGLIGWADYAAAP